MTNKEAIEIIKIAIAEVEWDYPMDYTVALEKAIEALEKMESIEYVMKLNLQYIDKIAHTKDISRKKSIKYIKEHLNASTRGFVKWSEEE